MIFWTDKIIIESDNFYLPWHDRYCSVWSTSSYSFVLMLYELSTLLSYSFVLTLYEVPHHHILLFSWCMKYLIIIFFCSHAVWSTLSSYSHHILLFSCCMNYLIIICFRSHAEWTTLSSYSFVPMLYEVPYHRGQLHPLILRWKFFLGRIDFCDESYRVIGSSRIKYLHDSRQESFWYYSTIYMTYIYIYICLHMAGLGEKNQYI